MPCLIRRLAEQLTERYGKGFSYPNVKRMRQFYLTFPSGSAQRSAGSSLGPTAAGSKRQAGTKKGSTALSLSADPSPATAAGLFPPILGWSHYLVLMRIENPTARSFYEIEAAKDSWSVRELERQVASLLFERLAMSRDQKQVLALGTAGQTVVRAEDVLKDPFVLEFLGQKERPGWLEHDLERAIMDRLEERTIAKPCASRHFCSWS